MERNDLTPKSNNPAFNSQYLEDVIDVPNGEVMTISGTVNKTAISLLIVVLAAAFSWNISVQGFGDMAQILTTGSGIFAFIIGLIIIFKRMSPAIKFLVPVYAFAEGLLLGGLSFIFEKAFPGIVHLAIQSTLLCVAVMLALYKFGVIKVTDKLRSTVILATITVFGIYIIDLILSLFGIRVPMVTSTSMLGILFSVVVVGIASFNLLLDFDFIEAASQRFFPKHIEWYGAFGLMVTIVWLYLELLKLLAKLQRRD